MVCCSGRCIRVSEDKCQQFAGKTTAVVKNSALTSASVGLLNYELIVKNGTLNTLFKSATTEQAWCAASFLPSTNIMTCVSIIDTLCENLRDYDPSWFGVCVRKGPGLVALVASASFFGLAAPEAAGFYAFYRVVDTAAKAFVSFGKGKPLHPIKNVREFFANLGHVVTREERDRKKEERFQTWMAKITAAAAEPTKAQNEGFFKSLFNRKKKAKVSKTTSEPKGKAKSEKKH